MRHHFRFPFAWAVPLLLLSITAAADEPLELPNPFPRELLVGPALHHWDFDNTTEGWGARNQCELSASEGHLKIRSLGGDPYLSAPVRLGQGGFVVRLRMRSRSSGIGQFFWTSTRNATTSPEHVVTFQVEHDGEWHEYQTRFDTDGELTSLRLDPSTAKGDFEVDWISIHHGRFHPLEINEVRQQPGQVVAIVTNHDDQAIHATVNGQTHTIDAGEKHPFVIPSVGAQLAALMIKVQADGLPSIQRTVWAHDIAKPIEFVSHHTGDLAVHAARDGSEIRLLRDGTTVAALAPLVHADFQLPSLQLQGDNWPLVYKAEGITVTLDTTSGGDLRIAIESDHHVEGPVLRTFGELEQGLLAGVEYLGKGETSSSKLDIETPEHLRVRPPPMHLTMPLAALVTDRSSVAMLWDDPTLQPTFAAPDFLDGAPGQRVSLEGKRISATVRVTGGWNDGARLEDLIYWAVKSRGLPDLPKPPRAFDAQMQLSLKAYSGLIGDRDHGGWFHAVVPGVRRSPRRGAYLADCASAIWRITGKPPKMPSLAHGGAHVPNSAIYFVTGRGRQWLDTVNRVADGLIKGQQPDGSYRYGGKFRRGHFEDTASGVCSRPAYQLLDHAYYTGDQRSLQAGLKTLQFMKRFRTPRGAQTWEVPLHTPDILASAQATWAYTRAFQLTGDRSHLNEARRWAITGLPFVYQWSNQPIMSYATTPVLGATNWKAPNWIGLPVQWCGTVYAYALLMLAPYDDTFDWRRIAEGITICAEQMQYPDGESVGTLPDVFNLPKQSRHPADINPSALVSLRLLLAGRPDALSMAASGPDRVVAPFPVTIVDGKAMIEAQSGIDYQILINGEQIMDIKSVGKDIVDLRR